jgi:subtilisin-like proprotein convertase family protein
VAAPTTTYTDNGLANGFTEYYSVQAVGANQACEGPMGACVTGTPQPCAGAVTLNKQIFNCADNIQISMVDGDLVGAGTYNVAASSTTETTPETVTLVETPANSGIFVGNILTTSAPPSPNGQLSVANGNTILVRYVDVSFCGTPNVNVDANGAVDCAGPVITNVHHTNVTGNSATVLWDTNENSSSSVTYAAAPGPPGTTPPPDPALVLSHSFTVTGLSPCSPYVYQVGSTDGAGNSATNNNGGAYYSFTTGVNVQPTYTYSGAPVPIPDNNPTGATAIIPVPDNKAIVDLNVTLGSLTQTYDGDIVVHVIGPDNTDVILSNRRGADGDNFTSTVFDDSAATAISAGTAPFTGTFRPDGALSAFTGKIAAGNWKLFVVDQANADTGSIVSWSLNFTYAAQQCGPSSRFSSSPRPIPAEPEGRATTTVSPIRARTCRSR